MLQRAVLQCYTMCKPFQHSIFNMLYNMLYDMFERYAPDFERFAPGLKRLTDSEISVCRINL